MKVKAATNTKTGNPTYVKMVTAAITELKERNGSSRQAILKYIMAKYKVIDKRIKTSIFIEFI